MNAPANSPTPVVRVPRRVLLALTLLWVVWAAHAWYLLMCLLKFGSVPIGRVLVAALEAFLIYLIGKGHRHARNVFALILIFLVVGFFFAARSELLSPTGTALVTLDALAVFLLYMSAVREWFK